MMKLLCHPKKIAGPAQPVQGDGPKAHFATKPRRDQRLTLPAGNQKYEHDHKGNPQDMLPKLQPGQAGSAAR